MDIAASELMTRIAELGQNRANADVTLNCEGITIKAHSFILELRYENYKKNSDNIFDCNVC